MELKSTVTVETKSGIQEIGILIGINWQTSQPIYNFEFAGLYFDSIWNEDFFYSSKHSYRLKIKDASDFLKKKSTVINFINQKCLEVNSWDELAKKQERMHNL